MSTFGNKVKINLFGESHGNGVGIVINNFPPGIKLDFDDINMHLGLRRPKSSISTPRIEKDAFSILSGYYKGFTTGAPLTFFIENTNKRSEDYEKTVFRPSHADYTAHIKYKGYEDYRGGGHFSGRLTAPLMILGSICKQLLNDVDIYVGSHISSIKNLKDDDFNPVNITTELVKTLVTSDFPLINTSLEAEMKSLILDAKSKKDSVGGVIQTAIVGLKPGYGEPFFDSIESTLSHLLFSIPAIKGVSFGKGFDITKYYGSEVNDPFYYDKDEIKTSSNNSGGIQGGISNGMPILVNIAVKPTASIGKTQETVDITSSSNTLLNLEGRHDPSIIQRAIHVINAITYYAVFEIISRNEGFTWIK